ncbi:MAG TPA: APC family permease [Candidatus Dormibacteraeota bacterium]|nr:APC family permease [Candidatus Dormibacteraeota bacterium]
MTAATARGSGEPGQKGLKGGALGFISGVVIGVASTAPGYSLAASLGLVAAGVGFQAPAIMLLAFVPMLFIAAAYYYLNRADPDCGTTFSWVTRAMGPWWGWMGGWGIILADIIVMANLSEIASIYSFELFGISEPSSIAILAVGVAWIAVMTLITWIGIELSARTQVALLGMELLALGIFAVVALVRVYGGGVENSVLPSIDWVNPLLITDGSALAAGLIIAIFIYWGWDSTVTVNEESRDATEGPGKAALVSTVILLLTYVLVSVAAQAFHGVDFLVAEENQGDVLGALGTDVLGSPLDKLLIIAVLTSAAASTQTTILPTARTALSMAAKRALPRYWGRITPRFLTPGPATIWMGILSIAWYVGLKIVSENILFDAIAALGLMIAFYYGLTGYACVIYYRRQLTKSVKNFVFIGLSPFIGALILTWALVQSAIDLADPVNSESGDSWFGFGPPLVIAVVMMSIGVVLMILQRLREPEFFRRKAEVVDPRVAIHGAVADASESTRAGGA